VDSTLRRTWADRLRFWIRIANRVEALELRWLGVSGVSLLRRRDVLVLETIGRRTGKRRRSPVTYLRDDDGSYRIGGGAGGMTRVDWVANLRARDSAVVYVRRTRRTVRVHELRGDQRDRAHAAAAARWPEVLEYEPLSNRQIPYFRLTPLTEEGP
jgi:deazaflavin-dependent oxidoreductase (nitroreductase family)